MGNYSFSLRFFISHSDTAVAADLVSMLEELGHEVIGTSHLCRETLVRCALNPPEIILSGLNFTDGDGIETLAQILENNPIPSIILAQHEDIQRVEEAVENYVLAYLIQPFKTDVLRPSIVAVKRRFDQIEELKAEVFALKETLENRKKLERAKGLLIKEKGIDEETAYLEIQSLAKKSREKMGVIAQVIIDSYK